MSAWDAPGLALGPDMSGDLDHWQDDTFRVTWDRADSGANLVTFEVGDGNRPETVRTRIVGREAVWRRSGDPSRAPDGGVPEARARTRSSVPAAEAAR